MTRVSVYKCELVLQQPPSHPPPNKKRECHMDVCNNYLICMQNEPLMLLLFRITGLPSALQNFETIIVAEHAAANI